ncbi:hypothetical protein ACFQJ7_12150 [Halovenus rubra]|uniref:Uncharacterized protein n=2 Tax=Halovenus rubra TaxID=869890 RepID=A0ABD5X6N0_9EURY|nr:hypothetical protein [Halovenus rubra]
MAISDYYGAEPDEISPFEDGPAVRGGTVAGFIATLLTSIAIVAVDISMLSDTIAGMYGFQNALAIGLATHLVHGTVFGAIFALVLTDPSLAKVTNSLWKTALAGVVYGLVLSLVATGFIMPVWVDFVGVSTIESMPYVTTSLVGWHALYGLVLGAMFPFLEKV